MVFFQIFGAAIFLITVCSIIALSISWITSKDDETAFENLWIGFLIVIAILSFVFGTFVTHPEDYGYTKINTVSDNNSEK